MKNKMLILPVIVILSLVSPILAIVCDLDVSLLNQDPYPSVPGDYVEVVFQVSGVENPDCGLVTLTLNEQYPINFDPGVSPSTTIGAGTFTKDFSSFFMVPYKVRVDENALDGENPIEVSFAYGAANVEKFGQSKQFNLQVKDIKADFEITIKDLVNLIVQLTEFKGKVIWDNSKPDGQPRRMLNTSKAEIEFGFKAKTSFEKGLIKTIDWYKYKR